MRSSEVLGGVIAATLLFVGADAARSHIGGMFTGQTATASRVPVNPVNPLKALASFKPKVSKAPKALTPKPVVPKAPGKLPAIAAPTLFSTKGQLIVDGISYPIIPTDLTPRGKFVVQAPLYLKGTAGPTYGFKRVHWSEVPTNNPIREIVRKGSGGDVLYSIHSGRISMGCLVLTPENLAKVGPSLVGKTIEIR
jgi:hypothetical protein